MTKKTPRKKTASKKTEPQLPRKCVNCKHAAPGPRNASLHPANHKVTCRRYPRFEIRALDDYCGEFKSK